jgi:hypothetical protein
MRKNRGDKGNPFSRPHTYLKKDEAAPFIRTEKETFEIQLMI